ncbi:MAG: AAA family ATPase [Chlamydiota bacterium]
MFYKRTFKAPERESFFLFGPRGTGKTTWLKHAYANALWIDLLDPREERLFSMHPELLRERIDANPQTTRVVIDEVQKVPKILDVVHGLIEEKQHIQFILTGSSSRKLRRGGVNLLAGRALWKNFHPFIAFELKEEFYLEKALKTGMIPLIWNSSIENEKLEAYVDLYLQEEVKSEALVRQIGEFSRFLQAMAHSHGSILNLTNVSRECEVSRKTVEFHLQILKDLLLGYTISVFKKRAKRATTAHPKFYYFDPGIYRALKQQGFVDSSTEAEGAALEGLIAEHLRYWIDFQKEKSELFFWRTQAGLEVDFVVYGEKAFYAFEVKNNKVISSSDLRGLKEFKKDYPEASLAFIYRGKEKLQKDGIPCIPAEDFLKNLDPSNALLF